MCFLPLQKLLVVLVCAVLICGRAEGPSVRVFHFCCVVFIDDLGLLRQRSSPSPRFSILLRLSAFTRSRDVSRGRVAIS